MKNLFFVLAMIFLGRNAFATLDPFSGIDAVYYNDRSQGVGMSFTPDNDDNKKRVAFINSGSWIRFDDIDFNDGADAVGFKTIGSDGEIQIILDDINNKPVAIFEVPKSGWDQWENISIPLNPSIRGKHSVYLRFSKEGFHLKSFIFFKRNGFDPFTNIDAVKYDDRSPGVGMTFTPDEDDNKKRVAFIKSGSWIRFDKVDFKNGADTVGFKTIGSGGEIQVILDDIKNMPVAILEVPNSGWNNWENISSKLNEIVSGRHSVYLHFSKSGFDLKSFQFLNISHERAAADQRSLDRHIQAGEDGFRDQFIQFAVDKHGTEFAQDMLNCLSWGNGFSYLIQLNDEITDCSLEDKIARIDEIKLYITEGKGYQTCYDQIPLSALNLYRRFIMAYGDRVPTRLYYLNYDVNNRHLSPIKGSPYTMW